MTFELLRYALKHGRWAMLFGSELDATEVQAELVRLVGDSARVAFLDYRSAGAPLQELQDTVASAFGRDHLIHIAIAERLPRSVHSVITDLFLNGRFSFSGPELTGIIVLSAQTLRLSAYGPVDLREYFALVSEM
jgi:hypothetical protein